MARCAASKLTSPVILQKAPIIMALGIGLPTISRAISVAGIVSTVAVAFNFSSSADLSVFTSTRPFSFNPSRTGMVSIQ